MSAREQPPAQKEPTPEELREFGKEFVLVIGFAFFVGTAFAVIAYVDGANPIFCAVIGLLLTVSLFFLISGPPLFLKNWLRRH